MLVKAAGTDNGNSGTTDPVDSVVVVVLGAETNGDVERMLLLVLLRREEILLHIPLVVAPTGGHVVGSKGLVSALLVVEGDDLDGGVVPEIFGVPGNFEAEIVSFVLLIREVKDEEGNHVLCWSVLIEMFCP